MACQLHDYGPVNSSLPRIADISMSQIVELEIFDAYSFKSHGQRILNTFDGIPFIGEDKLVRKVPDLFEPLQDLLHLLGEIDMTRFTCLGILWRKVEISISHIHPIPCQGKDSPALMPV